MAWSLHITGVTWPGDRHLPLSPGIHEVPQSRWVQRGSCDRTYWAFVQTLGAPNSHSNLINVFPVKGGAALIFIIVSHWWQVFKLDHSNDLGFTKSPHFQTLTFTNLESENVVLLQRFHGRFGALARCFFELFAYFHQRGKSAARWKFGLGHQK